MMNMFEYLLSKSRPKDNNIIEVNDENIYGIVNKEIERLGTNADLNHIDVSMCTSFYDGEIGIGLFEQSDFCGDVSEWDTHNIVDMTNLFFNCKKFNSDISKWDTSNVKTMRCMCRGCGSFNCKNGGWDVSNVDDMQGMFRNCREFNQDIGNWDVSNCKNFSRMFGYCFDFNQDLSKWKMDENSYRSYMFYDTKMNHDYLPGLLKKTFN